MVWPCLEGCRHLDWLALTSALFQSPQLAESNQKETEVEAQGKKPSDALGIGGGGGGKDKEKTSNTSGGAEVYLRDLGPQSALTGI